MSSPAWLRTSGRPHLVHVFGRTSACTSKARNSTTHTIAHGTRNALDVVTRSVSADLRETLSGVARMTP